MGPRCKKMVFNSVPNFRRVTFLAVPAWNASDSKSDKILKMHEYFKSYANITGESLLPTGGPLLVSQPRQSQGLLYKQGRDSQSKKDFDISKLVQDLWHFFQNGQICLLLEFPLKVSATNKATMSSVKKSRTIWKEISFNSLLIIMCKIKNERNSCSRFFSLIILGWCSLYFKSKYLNWIYFKKFVL